MKTLTVLAAVAAIALPSVARAQAHMSSQTKVQYFAAFVDAAGKKAGEGKPGEARLICWSGLFLIAPMMKVPRWPQRNRQVLESFDKTCGPLWKGRAAGDAASILARYKTQVADYGEALAFPPFSSDSIDGGYEVHKRTIDALNIGPQAYKLAIEVADKLPAPEVVYARPPAGFNQMGTNLLLIATGQMGARKAADDKAFPAIKEQLDKIAGSIKGSDTAGEMTGKADELEKWIALLRAGKSGDSAVKTYTDRVAEIRADAKRKWAAHVAKQRMPASTYRGGDKAAVIAQLRSIYQKRFPKEKIVRVVLASDGWGPARGEGWWDGDVWKWSVFSRLSGVAIAVKTNADDTPYRVYNVSFGRERKGSGWTTPYVLATGYGRPILRENIDK
jgi:hypothetical protein